MLPWALLPVRQSVATPLREMREDLGSLIMRMLAKHSHSGLAYKLSPKAQEALLHYSYPGNFRELENILERAVALAVGQVIHIDDLQIQSTGHHLQETAEPDIVESLSEPADTAGFHSGSNDEFIPGKTQIQDYLDSIERNIIEQALQQTRYNRTQAAKLLGISFRSMRYRMERLDIN